VDTTVQNSQTAHVETYGYLNGDPVQNDIEELLLANPTWLIGALENASPHIPELCRLLCSDDWKIKPRLTLNYGLRYEINGTIRDTKNKEANFIPDGIGQVGQGISAFTRGLQRFRPHLGFAWDIFGNGRMALRGGILTFTLRISELWQLHMVLLKRVLAFLLAQLGFFPNSNASRWSGYSRRCRRRRQPVHLFRPH